MASNRITPKQEPAVSVVDRALEQVRLAAQQQARDFLCYDCIDKRCLNGSICKAFITMTDSMAWEMIAEKAELN